MTPQEIIERYLRADEYERLCMFLQFRELREAFEAIELQHEVTEPVAARSERAASPLSERLRIA